MARRALCGIVSAVCGLLVLATWAHAECVWVLWVESPTGSSHWQLGRGTKFVFDKPADCERAAEAPRDFKIAQVDREEKRFDKRLSGTEFWACLSDSIDPRGSKGK
jgi:hypothetical protein